MASHLDVITASFFYTFLETTLDTLMLLPSFNKHFSTSQAPFPITWRACCNLFGLRFCALMHKNFALSLLCFIIIHMSLLLSNTTTVEVFGTKKMFWFFPLFSEEDLKNIPALHGLDFPIRSDMGE